MPSTPTSLLLNLDFYADGGLSDALREQLPAADALVELRLSNFDAPVYSGARYSLLWPELSAAADRLIDEARRVSEDAGAAPVLYLGGQAPLPLFVHVGNKLAKHVGPAYFASWGAGRWEFLPVQAEEGHRRPFFSTYVTIPPMMAERGRVAIFVSILGQPAPQELIVDLFRRHNQGLVALIEISTPHRAWLDATTSPQAFTQLREFLKQSVAQFPDVRGAVLFVAGPSALAGMLGLAVPEELSDLWIANFDYNAYHVAVPALPQEVVSVPEEAMPALRLDRLRVRGFKSIRDSGELAVPKPVVFVGRNGSGKSSLVEALQWLRTAAISGVQAATQPFHAFSDLLNKSSDALEIELGLSGEAGEGELRYRLVVVSGTRGVPRVAEESCTFGERSEIYTEGGARVIADGPPLRDPDKLALAVAVGTEAKGAVRLHAFLRNAVFLRLNPRALARPGPLQLDPNGPSLDEEGAMLPALLDSLSPEGLQELTSRLQAIFAEAAPVEGVGVSRNELERTGVLVLDQLLVDDVGPDGARHRRPFRIPAWVLSEGTRRLTAIFALLARRPAPSFLAIEEIENGLDPWTLGHVFDALVSAAEAGIGVAVTTHSPFFLDKFEPHQVVHVSYKNGESYYRPITTYEDVVHYEGEVPPGVMYVSDYFVKRS